MFKRSIGIVENLVSASAWFELLLTVLSVIGSRLPSYGELWRMAVVRVAHMLEFVIAGAWRDISLFERNVGESRTHGVREVLSFGFISVVGRWTISEVALEVAGI